MAEKHQLGKDGEKAAQQFVLNIGFQIVETNWRIAHLEIDMIAMDGHELVIIEVKARTHPCYEHPGEFISRRQELNLIEAADHYMEQKGLQNEVRFDLITLLPGPEGFVIEHFRDAFHAYS